MARKDRPIYTDEHGTRRFKGNAVVKHLLEEARAGRKCDMNMLHESVVFGQFTQADWQEFYQMIGHSLSGYAEIFPRSKERT